MLVHIYGLKFDRHNIKRPPPSNIAQRPRGRKKKSPDKLSGLSLGNYS